MKPKAKLNVLAFVLFSLPAVAMAQGTAFSYQGRLVENGVPANGGHDFIFTVFDSAAGAAQIGPAVPLNNTPVANGQFNVVLDFGVNVFTGAPRWLEISVRPAGVGQFTKMGARVSLLPTPYATYAATSGAVAGGGVTANQLNTAGVAPKAGQFLSYSGGNLSWSDPGVATGNIWSRNGADAYYSAGNVGIGTSTPTVGVSLEVNGNARVTPGGSGGFVQIGTPSGETGMAIIGANRADIRFDGSTLKLLAGPGTTPPGKGITIDTAGNVGMLNFGSVLEQQLSLWSDPAFTRYFGIGIQDSTLYNRCGGGGADGFAWYKGGVHDNHFHNGGGGQLLMTLDSNGLYAAGPASVCSLTIRGGCDLAEPFPMKEEKIEKGSVVVIDDEHPGQLKLSTEAYDTRVAGVISGANGLNAGIALHQEGLLEGGQNVALSGRVYVQADADFGVIKPGDLLTTARTPGHAMKVSDHARAQGAILGKAMSALKAGKGTVLVLVTLQ
jgi:hypothetical protein